MRIGFMYEQEYLPNKRCRKPRTCNCYEEIEVELTEVQDEEFPVAFRVTQFSSVSEEKEVPKSHQDERTEFRPFTQELRYYQGKLFRKAYRRYGATIYCNQIKDLEEVAADLTRRMTYMSGKFDDSTPLITPESILLNDNREAIIEKTRQQASRFILFKGEIWETCTEPMYVAMTFGLGGNHGGTTLMITEYYNPNIASECYFRASDREKAITYAIEAAKRRRDTESINRIGKDKMIEIVDPAMVRRVPENRI